MTSQTVERPVTWRLAIQLVNNLCMDGEQPVPFVPQKLGPQSYRLDCTVSPLLSHKETDEHIWACIKTFMRQHHVKYAVIDRLNTVTLTEKGEVIRVAP